MASKTIILVASASAKTGSKVVKFLSEAGSVDVRALVRNPESDAAKALAALPNVTVVKGDFDDASSLVPLLAGVTRAFLVSAPGEDTQYDREVAFIAAASNAGLEAVVRISTANCLIGLDSTGVYARAHARIEQYIAEHKSKVVDLQPNWFMDNWLGSAGEAKATGKITWPVPGDSPAPFAMIDTRDVAGAATAILLADKDKLAEFLALGRVQLHGPELKTFADKAAVLSKACGKEIAVNAVPPDAWVAAMVGYGLSEDFARSFKDTILIVSGKEEGKRPICNETSPLLLQIWKPKHTLADWAKDHAALFA